MADAGLEQFLDEFLLDTRERLGRVEEHLLTVGDATGDERVTALGVVKRELHTIKGNAGMMGLADIQQVAHAMEDRIKEGDAGDVDVASMLEMLDKVRGVLRRIGGAGAEGAMADESGEAGGVETVEDVEGSVRVPFQSLDALLDLMADMIITRNRLTRDLMVSGSFDPGAPDYAERTRQALAETRLSYERLGRAMDSVHTAVTGLRMVPLSSLFTSLRRLVHDESVRERKDVRIETAGGDTPLDKALLDLANEVLGHLVRNSIIHGVEAPDVREAAGKPRQATVRVSAAARGDQVAITVSDDGGGIDPDRIREVARERGIDTDTLENIYSVLFLPGFSTKTEVDLGSGRGVGLEAVLEAVERQGGTIEVSSEAGHGTSFHMILPLTVSIARALLVTADGEEYAMPLSSVVEVQHLDLGDGHRVNNAGVFRWRGEVVTMLDLGHFFETAPVIREEGYVIVTEAVGKKRGLLVDTIDGIEEVVVKGLEPVVGAPAGVAGTTVLGDGRPILILDPRALVTVEPFMGRSA